jgi:sugar phosphate isomerase/epimerase
MADNQWPKLHNAMWPGVVGKGQESEPFIDLDTMLDLTNRAEVNGIRYDGVDLFLSAPHVDIDSSDDDLGRLADKLTGLNFVAGSLVAPVWPPTGGGSAMGTPSERKAFLTAVEKACKIGGKLRSLGVRPYGLIRIDSATGVEAWDKDPVGNQKIIAQTFTDACDIAEAHGEQLACEGEICWGGMHGWKSMLELMEMVGRPKTLGFQADMAHTLLYTMGYNAEEQRILPADFEWGDQAALDTALRTLTDAMRPWTLDFHVAQNDGTVKGMGSHDKTGRHCLATDPNGRLDIVKHAGFWLNGPDGKPTKAMKHICWDGCMFSNDIMLQPKIWNDVLEKMVAIRETHGWN